jgi:F0F1-type ATP synthase assembly protein I
VDRGDQRETYNGFGDTLARAFELAVTPLVFAGLGWLLDRAFGTGPVLALAFLVLAVAGSFARMYYRYEEAMRRHDAAAPWGRPQGPSGPLSGDWGP